MKVFRHYKGGLYEFVGEATHSETGELVVAYRSKDTGRLWVRPITMFYDSVEVDGKQIGRFVEVQEAGLIEWTLVHTLCYLMKKAQNLRVKYMPSRQNRDVWYT